MRGRHRTNYDYIDRKDILFIDFVFFNKMAKLITETQLNELKDKLKTSGQREIYWTNDDYMKNKVAFRLKKINGEIYASVISIKYHYTVEQINNTKSMVGGLLVSFNVTDEQYDIINDIAHNSSIPVEMKSLTTIDSWDDLVNIFIQSNNIGSYEPRADYEWVDYKKDMKTIFNDIELNKQDYVISRKGYHYPKVMHIMKVIEKRINDKNYRTFLFMLIGDYSSTYGINSVDETNPNYNFIDEGRLSINVEGKDYFVDLVCNEFNGDRLIVDLNMFRLISRSITQLIGNDKVITPSIYRFYRAKTFNIDDSDTGQIKDEKEILMLSRYKELLAKDKEIKIDDVLISKGKITIGDDFNMEFTDDFLDVEQSFMKIRKIINVRDARFNYNTIYEGLLHESKLNIIQASNVQEDEYKSFKPQTYKINNIEIRVAKISNRVRINGIFCRIVDLFHILSKAICYTDTDSFNRYVRDVSAIGIEWKKIISNGLLIELANPFNDVFRDMAEKTMPQIYLRFSFIWDEYRRRNVYLSVNDKKYLIVDKVKAKKFFNYPKRQVSMFDLKTELNQCIDGINDDTIVEIVEEGIEEAKIVQKRGLELVANTIKDINAMETSIQVRQNQLQGYLVVGRMSGSQYFIEKLNLDVYKNDNGTWNRRCVVDDHSKQRIFEDRLANRLVNIYNEPERIHTIHN